MPRKLWLIPIAVVLLAAGGTIYRWVDEAGTVHYSDRAPPSGSEGGAVELQPEPAASEMEAARARLEHLKSELATAQQQRETAEEQARTERLIEQAQRVARERSCALIHQNLYALAQPRPVFRIDQTGQRVYLDDAARAAEVKRLEAERAEQCD